MNNLKNLALTTLLAVAAVGCKNDSPTPQNVVVKPVEPTVLPNEKCYKGIVIHQNSCMRTIVIQVQNDSIGIKSNVSCLGVYNNVLTLDAPNEQVFQEWSKPEVKELYFTVSKFVTVSENWGFQNYKDADFNVASSGCAAPLTYFLPCGYNNGMEIRATTMPSKYAKVGSYSYKSCETGK